LLAREVLGDLYRSVFPRLALIQTAGGSAALRIASELVARFSQIEGYRCLSLTRAFGVVKCQFAVA
jgi:hypothetical protein